MRRVHANPDHMVTPRGDSLLKREVAKLLPRLAAEGRKQVRQDASHARYHTLVAGKAEAKRYWGSVQMGPNHVRTEGRERPRPPILFRGEPMGGNEKARRD